METTILSKGVLTMIGNPGGDLIMMLGAGPGLRSLQGALNVGYES